MFNAKKQSIPKGLLQLVSLRIAKSSFHKLNVQFITSISACKRIFKSTTNIKILERCKSRCCTSSYSEYLHSFLPCRSFISSSSSAINSFPLEEPSALWNKELLMNCYANGLVHFQLNRPKFLNALSFDMCNTLWRYLQQLDEDDRCTAIIVTGSGDKAFCAGGDIKTIQVSEPSFICQFFRAEYALDYLTSILKKPYICIWKGYVMGGGAGISVHGRYRICTDNTMFSMPETTIGLFPDVGIQYVFSRLKDGLGLYAGLTSNRFNAVDCLNHGLANHFIQQDKIENFMEDLKKINIGIGEEADKNVTELIKKYESDASNKIKPFFNEELLKQIDKYFSNATCLKTLMKDLENNVSSNDFCKHTVDVIAQRCPLSCHVWFRQHELGRNMILADCLRMDYKLAQSLTIFNNVNFYEGVRAQLIDKDKKPKWVPASINQVESNHLLKIFECSGCDELDII